MLNPKHHVGWPHVDPVLTATIMRKPHHISPDHDSCSMSNSLVSSEEEKLSERREMRDGANEGSQNNKALLETHAI